MARKHTNSVNFKGVNITLTQHVDRGDWSYIVAHDYNFSAAGFRTRTTALNAAKRRIRSRAFSNAHGESIIRRMIRRGRRSRRARSNPSTKSLLVFGGLAVAGAVGLYFLFRKPAPQLPPAGATTTTPPAAP